MDAERRANLSSLARRAWSGPLIPVVVAIVLGLLKIGDKSLSLDEGFSVNAALLPTRALARVLLFDELHASPYYLSLQPWTWLGTSEAVLRSLSVVYGAIAVLGTYFVGKRYGVAFPAALILATAPFFIEFEQEARGYTMLMAGAAVSTLFYLRMVERPGVIRAGAYVAAAGLMIYLQPLGALVVVGHALWMVLSLTGRDRWRLLSVYPLILLAWTPMLVFAVAGRNPIAWMGPTGVDEVINVAIDISGGAVLLGLVLVMLAIGMRRDLPALWLLVPIVGTLLVTFLVQPVHQSRYMVAILPAAAIILARNRPVAIAALLAISLVGVGNWYFRDPKPDWRGAATWVAADVQPGDGIVFAPHYLRNVFGYYAHVAEPLYSDAPWARSDLVGGRPDIPGILSHERIWLVEGHGGDRPDSVRTALAAFEVATFRDYGGNGVRVSLLQRNPLTLVSEP